MSVREEALWKMVERWAGIDPAFTALRGDGPVVTYGELDAKTDALARNLLALGVRKGDAIVTMLPCSAEYIMTLLAADKIGAIVVPMDIKYRKADLERFIAHIEPAAVISVSRSNDRDLTAVWREVDSARAGADGTRYIFTGDSEFGYGFAPLLSGAEREAGALAAAKADQDMDDGLLVVFTGGTTGVPKAALLSRRNVATMAAVEAGILATHVDGRITTIASLPPSHVGGTVEMIGMALAGGYEIIVHDSWSPQRTLEAVQAERIQWIGGVPTMFAIMLLMPDIERYDLSSLKVAILSGEKVELELIRAIKRKICPNVVIGYGSTEAGSEVTFTLPGDDERAIADGYVGRPLPGADIRVVDPEGRALPAGEKGEVVVAGPYTIRGYYKMPDEDAAGFTADGYCKTGDLGYLDAEGGLYIKGRIKHIIRVGSYTVLPSEVEDVLLKSGLAGMAAAIGVPDPVYGEVVWAVVSPFPGVAPDPDALLRLCGEELAGFKVPRRVLVWDELPITRIGKVHRVEVQNRVREMIAAGKL